MISIINTGIHHRVNQEGLQDQIKVTLLTEDLNRVLNRVLHRALHKVLLRVLLRVSLGQAQAQILAALEVIYKEVTQTLQGVLTTQMIHMETIVRDIPMDRTREEEDQCNLRVDQEGLILLRTMAFQDPILILVTTNNGILKEETKDTLLRDLHLDTHRVDTLLRKDMVDHQVRMARWEDKEYLIITTLKTPIRMSSTQTNSSEATKTQVPTESQGLIQCTREYIEEPNSEST